MKLKAISSEISDASWESENRPKRKKLSIWFQELDDDGLQLTMLVPLDPAYDDEARAQQLFAPSGDSISVRCTIDSSFNLDAEQATFTLRLKELYKSDIGQILRSAELTKVSDRDLRQVLQPLVSQGQNVFRRLFASDQINYSGYADEDVEIVRSAVLSAFSRPQSLYISSNCPLFPWAFLYYGAAFDPSNYSTIRPELFWGFMHEIQEEFSTTPQRLPLAENPEVVTAVDPLIDNSGMHDADDHPFAKVKRVPASNIGDLRAKLVAFESHCLYFYGHADHAERPTQTSSWLELQRLRLYVSDLEPLRAPQFKNNPVVAFLNGCNTSPLTRWDSNTVVGYLCNHGKKHLCCVASVGQLPASFAAEFAREFWQEFLINRLPIGTALQRARCFMLDRFNNPLGLLYSLFGRVETFVPPVSSAPVTSANTNAPPTQPQTE